MSEDKNPSRAQETRGRESGQRETSTTLYLLLLMMTDMNTDFNVNANDDDHDDTGDDGMIELLL